MAQSHSTLISWALAFPNSHMVPLSISSNPDHQHRSQNAFTSASGARQLHRSFSIILPRVSSSCLFPFFQSLSKLFKRVLSVEYPSFGDKRIQRILLSGYRLRGGYQWVLLQSSIWRPIPSRIPRTEEDNVVASFSRSILPTTTLPTYPLPAASSSLTTIHNIDSNGSGSSNPFLRLFWNPNLLSASSELENGNVLSGGEGIITRDINRRRLLLAAPTVDQRLLGTGFHLFLSPDSLRKMHLGTIDNRAQDITSQPLPYTSNNNGDNAMASVYHHQRSHSVGGTTAASNFLFPTNVDFHTGQQQFLHCSQVTPSASQPACT